MRTVLVGVSVVEHPASAAPVACGEVSDDDDDEELELEDELDGVVDGVLLLGGGGGVEELLAGAVDDGAETVGPLSPPHAVMPNRVAAPAEARTKRVREVGITTLFR